MTKKNFHIWYEKYRPDSIDKLLLSKNTKRILKGIVKKNEITNLLFYGSPGTGKTSAAKILCKELNVETIFINGADAGIDFLRNTLTTFASSISFEAKKKVVIIDEADRMSDQFSQAFNSFIEKYHKNCNFILTTNHPNKLFPALRSRFGSGICFDIVETSEKKELIANFLNVCEDILKKENITYEKEVLAKFILQYLPDLRRCLKDLQDQCQDGELSITSLARTETGFKRLIKILKERNWKNVYEFVDENHLDFGSIAIDFTENLEEFVKTEKIPILFKLIDEYQFRYSFAMIKEVTLKTFLMAVMMEDVFK